MMNFRRGQISRKRLCCLGEQKPMTYIDAGPVVPAAVEDHDLAAGRETLDMALDVHLALLAVGRRGKVHDPEAARADPLGDGLDRAALARSASRPSSTTMTRSPEALIQS